eukprot:5750641-Alexandrium_andersonii.AAC.1
MGLELSRDDLLEEYEVRLEQQLWELEAAEELSAEQEKERAELQKRVRALAGAQRSYHRERLLLTCGFTERLPNR